MEKEYLAPMASSLFSSRGSTVALIVGALLCLRCTSSTVVDALAIFQIDGVTLDENGQPLASVNIGFIDTGIDQWRHNKGFLIPIAKTDDAGRISTTFSYFYGYIETGRQWPLALNGTFFLSFDLDGYQATRKEFNIRDSPRLDDGTVHLKFRVVMRSQPSEV